MNLGFPTDPVAADLADLAREQAELHRHDAEAMETIAKLAALVGQLADRVIQLERDLARTAQVAQQGQGAVAVEILNDVIGHYTTKGP